MAIDGFAGVTAIDTRLGGPTVRVMVPVTAPDVALICEVPWATPLARPAAVMVAVAVFDDAQAAVLVRSCVDPSA